MITAIFNNKGGSGKSTTAVNLAAALALKGKKTLLIDLDAQCNGSTYAGTKDYDKDSQGEDGRSVYDALFGTAECMQELVRETSVNGLYCIPSSLSMQNASSRLSRDPLISPATILYAAIRKSKIEKEYEHIIIDCPSDIDLITANALNAAEACLIPAFADDYSLDGIEQSISAIDKAANNGTGNEIKLLGVLLCNYRANTSIAKQIAADLEAAVAEYLINTKIRMSTTIPASIHASLPAVVFAPKDNAAKEYMALAEEYERRIGGACD